MHVSKTENGYVFFVGVRENFFNVHLCLDNEGGEELRLKVIGLEESRSGFALEPGSIRKFLGSERWADFVRMREQGFDKFYLPPAGAVAVGTAL